MDPPFAITLLTELLEDTVWLIQEEKIIGSPPSDSTFLTKTVLLDSILGHHFALKKL